MFAPNLVLSRFEILVADGNTGKQYRVILIELALGGAELLVEQREHFEAHSAWKVHALPQRQQLLVVGLVFFLQN